MAIAAMAAVPLAPATQAQSPPTVTGEVRLAAATVPPGGLITSFLGNQVLYCSIICPLVVETAATAFVTTLQTPVTFLAALQSGDLLKAIGVAAASVTGPTNAAAQAAILADGTLVAPRALNAFEVGVVGLLNVIPAAADGLPGIVTAIQTARQDTFTALNLPIAPNPTPTVMPRGVVQVVVVEAINVGAAIIFPAFNHVLSAIFETPDAVAQELAATGDPVRALAAGADALAGRLTAAVTVIADSVVIAGNNIHAAVEQSRLEHQTAQATDDTRTTPVRATEASTRRVATTEASSDDSATTTEDDNTEFGSTDRPRDVSSTPADTVRNVVEKDSERPHRTATSRPDSSNDSLHTQEAGNEADDAAQAPRTESPENRRGE